MLANIVAMSKYIVCAIQLRNTMISKQSQKCVCYLVDIYIYIYIYSEYFNHFFFDTFPSYFTFSIEI